MKLPFRKEKELYLSLYNIIGFYPHDISYYKLALMHKSLFRRNAKGKPVNNERLEFLGDAILDAAVGDIVYRHFPGKREGFLTNTRSKLVQRETLNRLAQEMGITKLVVSNGRSLSHNSYMGGNAFEALVGAIYLDRGYDACMQFIKKRILAQMINIDKVAYKEVNFKSKLIEWAQKNRVKIEFRQISAEKDKNGSPVFCYAVEIEGVTGCDATGYSKKESQQLASKRTLEKLRKESAFLDSVFAAKTNRTKMEEEPVENVPSTEQPDFIVVKNEDAPAPTSSPAEAPAEAEAAAPATTAKAAEGSEAKPAKQRRQRRSPMYADPSADNAPAAAPQAPAAETAEVASQEADEFDLSDITARDKTREEIIAAAEAAAFSDQ